MNNFDAIIGKINASLKYKSKNVRLKWGKRDYKNLVGEVVLHVIVKVILELIEIKI